MANRLGSQVILGQKHRHLAKRHGIASNAIGAIQVLLWRSPETVCAREKRSSWLAS